MLLNMKKWLLILGMITCILGMGACGDEQTDYERDDITKEEAMDIGEQVVEMMIAFCSDEYKDYRAQLEEQSAVYAAALSSWESAQADMGEYIGVLEKSAQLREDGVTINLKLDGSDHDANMEIILDDKLAETSITTNVEYSAGELMQKAGLNTLLGMGTVFVILILISVIISCFNFIPKIQAALSKKQPQAGKEAMEAKVENAIAQIVEKEELSDDLELVAVIAAAVAASEGAVSTDGFVVRSIRKRKF